MGNRFGTYVRRWSLALMLAGMGLSGSAAAILLDRGPDMVYDTVLNITWTRQAGDGVARNWPDSVAWANNLVFAGFDDWRLPYASVSAGAGPTATRVNCAVVTEVACRDDETAYMYFHNLGAVSGDNKTGTQTALGGEVLTSIQVDYWSATELGILQPPVAGGPFAWAFRFSNGLQLFVLEDLLLSAWAVRDGDVGAATLPEPASLLLIGFAALGLGWSRRRNS